MALTASRDQKKKKKAPLPRAKFRTAGELHDEPEIPERVMTSLEMMRALNYYNYVDLKDRDGTCRKWVFQAAEILGLADEARAIDSLESWRLLPIMGMSRLVIRGAVLPQKALNKLSEEICQIVVRSARVAAEAEKQKQKANKPRVFKVYSDAVSDVIATMEEMLDQVYDGGELSKSSYDLLVDREANLAAASAMIEKYQPELDEMAQIKSDKDLKEAYASLSKKEINRRMEVLRAIVDGAKRFVGNKKASTTRKPRKIREKSAVQLVKNLRYLAEHRELKLVSVSPEKLVGASVAWIYNVKYRTLRRLEAPAGAKLTVKGSSIHGFAETSLQKTLRKPEETLAMILGGTTPSARKVFEQLKTKAVLANGRVNEETILLRTH